METPVPKKNVKILIVPFRQFKSRIRSETNPKKVRTADHAIQRFVPDLGPDGTFTQARESIHLWKLEFGTAYMCSYMKSVPGAKAPTQIPLRIRIATSEQIPEEALLPLVSAHIETTRKATSCSNPQCKCAVPCESCHCK